jgi:hypothetical protein
MILRMMSMVVMMIMWYCDGYDDEHDDNHLIPMIMLFTFYSIFD